MAYYAPISATHTGPASPTFPRCDPPGPPLPRGWAEIVGAGYSTDGVCFEAITDDKLRAACAAAYFPHGLKLTQLEDEEYFNSSRPGPVPDSL